MDQRTPEWFAARVGKVTASRIADVCAKTKTGVSLTRANYLSQLVAETLTGQQAESYTNAAMQWGTEQEPAARDAYSAKVGELVEECGFFDHATLRAGASPDGLVLDGLVEIKCPNTQTHLDTIFTETVQSKYLQQMQFQMACTGRAWCDFVSFDPRLPNNLQLFVKRIPRDQPMIDAIEKEVAQFIVELDAKVKHLQEINL